MNLTELSDDELDNLRIEVLIEQERRQTLANAPAQADDLARRYRTATGAKDGDPWTQPTGAHDAHPEGWTVTHNGVTYRSLIPSNVWEPGPGSRWWEAVTEDGAPTPEWAVGTYYKVGDTVTYEGSEWECAHEHLGQAGWEPSNPGMHAVWKRA